MLRAPEPIHGTTRNIVPEVSVPEGVDRQPQAQENGAQPTSGLERWTGWPQRVRVIGALHPYDVSRTKRKTALELWQSLLVAFGGNAALLLVLGFLGRSLMSSLIAKDIEKFKADLAHDRATAVQAAQNSFALGATSHMANVAFDKHVAFSEEYLEETFNTLRTLFREGPTEKALPHAGNLHQIRLKWALWLTPPIESNLDKFEAAIRRIGADAHFVEVDQAHPDRSKVIQEMFALYKEVMGRSISDEPKDAEHAISKVVEALRRVLGTEELTGLRQTLVARSIPPTG